MENCQTMYLSPFTKQFKKIKNLKIQISDQNKVAPNWDV